MADASADSLARRSAGCPSVSLRGRARLGCFAWSSPHTILSETKIDPGAVSPGQKCVWKPSIGLAEDQTKSSKNQFAVQKSNGAAQHSRRQSFFGKCEVVPNQSIN